VQQLGRLGGGQVPDRAKGQHALGCSAQAVDGALQAGAAAIGFEHQVLHRLAAQAALGVDVGPGRACANQEVLGYIDLRGRHVGNLGQRDGAPGAGALAALGLDAASPQGQARSAERAVLQQGAASGVWLMAGFRGGELLHIL